MELLEMPNNMSSNIKISGKGFKSRFIWFGELEYRAKEIIQDSTRRDSK